MKITKNLNKKTYILEHNDPPFWRKVRLQAETEGTSIKAKILELLRRWLSDK